MQNENLNQNAEQDVKRNTEGGRLDGKNPKSFRPEADSKKKSDLGGEHPEKKQSLDDDIKDTFPASDPITHY